MQASSATPPGPWESRPPRDVPYHWTQLDAAHPATAIQLVSLPLPGQEGSPKLPSTVDPSVWAELVEQVGHQSPFQTNPLLGGGATAQRAEIFFFHEHM